MSADLEGLWGLEQRGLPCVQTLWLEGGDYEWLIFCELQSGRFGAQAEGGRYASRGDSALDLEPEYATCVDGRVTPITLTWLVSDGGQSLTLSSSSGAALWMRLTDEQTMGGGSGVVVYGCFEEDGAFREQPITAL